LLPYFVVFLFPVLSSTTPSIKSNMAPINVVLDIQKYISTVTVSKGFATLPTASKGIQQNLAITIPDIAISLVIRLS
jgi:hypothetical protein